MLQVLAILAAAQAAARGRLPRAAALGPLGRRLQTNRLDREIGQAKLSAGLPLNQRLGQRAATRPLVTLTAELDHLETIRSVLLVQDAVAPAT
jgi:hypothetical protein